MRASDPSVDATRPALRPDDVLELQQTVGNRATGQRLQRLAGQPSAFAEVARTAAGVGGPIGRRELTDAQQKQLAKTKLSDDPIAHIMTYYPDHHVTPLLGTFLKLRKSRDPRRTAFQAALSAASGVGAATLTPQEQAKLKAAGNAIEVRKAKLTVNQSQSIVDGIKGKIGDIGSQIKLNSGLTAGLKTQIEGVRVQAIQNQAQAELNEVNHQANEVKHKVDVLATLSEKIFMGIAVGVGHGAVGVAGHTFEGLGEFATEETASNMFADVGKMGKKLEAKATELRNYAHGSSKFATKIQEKGLTQQIDAYANRIKDLQSQLETEIPKLLKAQADYVESLRLLNETLKRQPGLKNLKTFDQLGQDTALINAFFEAARKYQVVVAGHEDIRTQINEDLEDAKRQFFSDPNFAPAQNIHKAIQSQWQPDRDELDAGLKRGQALKSKVEKATEAGLGALA